MLCVELLPHNTWVPPLLLRRRRSLVLQPALLPPPWLLAIYTSSDRFSVSSGGERTTLTGYRGGGGGEAHNEMRVPLTFLPLPVCLPPCLAVYVRILAMCSLVSYHREEGGRGRKACHPCFLLVLLFVPLPLLLTCQPVTRRRRFRQISSPESISLCPIWDLHCRETYFSGIFCKLANSTPRRRRGRVQGCSTHFLSPSFLLSVMCIKMIIRASKKGKRRDPRTSILSSPFTAQDALCMHAVA